MRKIENQRIEHTSRLRQQSNISSAHLWQKRQSVSADSIFFFHSTKTQIPAHQRHTPGDKKKKKKKITKHILIKTKKKERTPRNLSISSWGRSRGRSAHRSA